MEHSEPRSGCLAVAAGVARSVDRRLAPEGTDGARKAFDAVEGDTRPGRWERWAGACGGSSWATRSIEVKRACPIRTRWRVNHRFRVSTAPSERRPASLRQVRSLGGRRQDAPPRAPSHAARSGLVVRFPRTATNG